jgi:hypothetical protein
VLVSKLNLKKIKIYYFYTFSNEKHLKKQSLSLSQHPIKKFVFVVEIKVGVWSPPKKL